METWKCCAWNLATLRVGERKWFRCPPFSHRERFGVSHPKMSRLSVMDALRVYRLSVNLSHGTAYGPTWHHPSASHHRNIYRSQLQYSDVPFHKYNQSARDYSSSNVHNLRLLVVRSK